MEWSDLEGSHTLRGIRTDIVDPTDPDAWGVAVHLDDIVFLVFEDRSDDYRSYSDGPYLATEHPNIQTPAFDPLEVPVVIRVSDESGGYFRGIDVMDARNEKCILRLGTDNNDDYYPWAECEWTPENIWVEGTPK